MIKGINHIGLVVRNIDETLSLWSKMFGAVEIGRKAFPEIGQISCLVAVGEARFELMEALGPDGVVPKFIEKNGEGFHHISLLTDELDKLCATLTENGVRIVGKKGNVAFTHPKSTGGIVYELVEG